jgi:hypothetical protein
MSAKTPSLNLAHIRRRLAAAEDSSHMILHAGSGEQLAVAHRIHHGATAQVLNDVHLLVDEIVRLRQELRQARVAAGRLALDRGVL